MSAPRLCKYDCGKELYWDTAKSKFIELDGTEHTRERCESLKKKPATPKQELKQEALIAVITGAQAEPILKAITAGKSLHWHDASRDGLTILELFAEGKA